MFYDDVSVVAYTPTPAPTPEPTPAPTPEPTPSGQVAAEDMETYTADSANLSPWVAYMNQFDANGGYLAGYAVNPAPNGPQISAFATGEEGANNGTGYLNVYSNYDDATHQTGLVETNLYRELSITSEMVGTVTWQFDVKRPATDSNACGGTNADNSATGGVCKAFIKILDPNNNYNTDLFETVVTTEVSSTEWATTSVTATVASGDVGKLIQFGFQNTAGNYAPTGVYYDNMTATVLTPEPEPEPTADDLFIAEVGEGPSGTGSWGKYIEIANFTGSTVDLSGYKLIRVTNGADSVTGDTNDGEVAFADGATVESGDVYVIGRATNTDGSPESLYGQIDEVNTGISHNGDDAYALATSAGVIIDEFGNIAEDDPGSEFDVCGVDGTKDTSVIRTAGNEGEVDWTVSSAAATCEWTVVAQDRDNLDYSTVGNHTFVEPEAANN
tara:strand:- start:24 stop:1352 length:1329 start_codon:yes stop_codon:yes gene_type:complete